MLRSCGRQDVFSPQNTQKLYGYRRESEMDYNLLYIVKFERARRQISHGRRTAGGGIWLKPPPSGRRCHPLPVSTAPLTYTHTCAPHHTYTLASRNSQSLARESMPCLRENNLVPPTIDSFPCFNLPSLASVSTIFFILLCVRLFCFIISVYSYLHTFLHLFCGNFLPVFLPFSLHFFCLVLFLKLSIGKVAYCVQLVVLYN